MGGRRNAEMRKFENAKIGRKKNKSLRMGNMGDMGIMGRKIFRPYGGGGRRGR